VVKGRIVLSAVVLLAAFAVIAGAGDADKSGGKSAGLERFRQLAGEWTAKGKHGDKEIAIPVTYKVTAGGSAVVETIAPGTNHEMITVIHQDGDALALTHYCMLGNQPHMKARPKADDNKVAFEFVRASNLKSDKDAHMHDVTYTFVDKDRLNAEWTHYQDGKATEKMTFELTRSK
jgi:hypothetical protein